MPYNYNRLLRVDPLTFLKQSTFKLMVKFNLSPCFSEQSNNWQPKQAKDIIDSEVIIYYHNVKGPGTWASQKCNALFMLWCVKYHKPFVVCINCYYVPVFEHRQGL